MSKCQTKTLVLAFKVAVYCMTISPDYLAMVSQFVSHPRIVSVQFGIPTTTFIRQGLQGVPSLYHRMMLTISSCFFLAFSLVT